MGIIMTQEDKELLLKDLCARLPYRVVINCTEEDDERTNFNCFLVPDIIRDIKSETAYWVVKPYLRPLSSMTEEEKEDYNSKFEGRDFSWEIYYGSTDWLNEHHFDYRGLIEKGLALEAPEGIYDDNE
jgi:hypothetical protein